MLLLRVFICVQFILKNEVLGATISQFDICFVHSIFMVVPEQSSHMYYTNTVDYCAALCLAEGYSLIAVSVSSIHILDNIVFPK